MSGLTGKNVAICGERRASDLALLIEKKGGIPLFRSIQGSLRPDLEVAQNNVMEILTHPPKWMILTTGIGTNILLKAARELGKFEEFVACMSTIGIAARGYKTVQALKEVGLRPTVQDEDGTTAGLIQGLQDYTLKNERVLIQYYGDRPKVLAAWIIDQGVELIETFPYSYVPPKKEVLRQLVEEICIREIDAVTFTSAMQVRNLFQAASQFGRTDQMIESLQTSVIPTAIGKFTSEALRESGAGKLISPVYERMGSMIVALEEAFST